MTSIITGQTAEKALDHIVKAIAFYDEADIKFRGQILKGYAFVAFGLKAFDTANSNEVRKQVQDKLIPTLSLAKKDAASQESQRKKFARGQAELHIWDAHKELKKLGGVAFEAFDRLATDELSVT